MLTSVLMLEMCCNFTHGSVVMDTCSLWTLAELDLLLEVVPEVQLLLQHVTVLEKSIHKNPAMGHP